MMAVPCPPLLDATGGALPNTGAPVAAMLLAATAALALGVVALVVARRRARGVSAGLLAATVILLTMSGTHRAEASLDDCDAGLPGVVVVQTSATVVAGPGGPPTGITGEVRNVSAVEVYVTAVTVSIAGLTSAAGSCNVDDYVLTDVTMPVGRVLGPGDAAVFGGAQLGFLNKPVNQDDCQGAGLDLRYLST